MLTRRGSTHRPRQFTRLEILMNCGTPVHFAAGDFEFGCVPEERRGGLGGNKGKKSQESQVVALSRPTRVRRYTCICRRYTVSVEDTSYLSKIHAYLNSAKIRKRRPLHVSPHPLYIPLVQLEGSVQGERTHACDACFPQVYGWGAFLKVSWS